MIMKTVRHFRARVIAAAVAAGCVSVCPALAGGAVEYDRRIEEAAIRMLQPKLGEMRGSLDLDTDSHLYPPLDERTGASEEAVKPFGAARGSLISY